VQERAVWKINGFLALGAALVSVLLSVYLLAQMQIGLGILFLFGAIVIASALTIVQPNQSRVIVFFGRYMGSLKQDGFWMTVPFSLGRVVSLRVSNFNSKMLKVNDVAGNPVEIAAVVVFRVVDSAKAMFDVSNYEQFVEIQSETALRHVATKYPYDNYQEVGYSLRGNAEEVAGELTRELQERKASMINNLLVAIISERGAQPIINTSSIY
jgi:regulator of protease activity HflC (stomatin/prohibitin superfamily)